MPDIRKHRGPHPEDRQLFADENLPALREAVSELSWLLTRGYAIKGALKLVGDKFSLTERQRLAVSRAACSDQSKAGREASRIALQSIRGQSIIIDGFNLIITVEAALSGGLLFLSRDGCVRDLSSVHGSYRSVEETEQAIRLVGETLAEFEPAEVIWILDQPISNSGRLAQRIRQLAGEQRWPWTVELAFNPDAEIVSSGRIAISSDGPLLDQVDRWNNLARHIVERHAIEAWLIDLS
jgi:hypothetical protein